MVFEFTFKNYRSYKEETTLSFVAKEISEHEDSLIKSKNEKLVPVTAIYGPNGGGKSSVLMAFRYMTSLIVPPFIALQSAKGRSATEEMVEKRLTSLEREYYIWDESYKDVPSFFSVLFTYNNTKYRYEISVLDAIIEAEALYAENEEGEADIIFERKNDDISLDERLLNGIPENAKVSSNLPFLVYVGMLMDIKEVDDVINFFFSVAYINFDNNKRDRYVPIKRIIENKERILGITQKMGITICDLRAEEDENGTIKKVYVRHCIGGTVSDKEMDFESESSGTRKLFSLIYSLIQCIDSGRMVIIDELDAKLHPLLLKSIISLFTNSEINKNGSQLLFTSHDIPTMDKDVFRRDEIWFAALNDNEESILYSLVDFKKENGAKPRNDEAYGKQYIEGRYGADPYIKRIIDWEGIA